MSEWITFAPSVAVLVLCSAASFVVHVCRIAAAKRGDGRWVLNGETGQVKFIWNGVEEKQ